MRSDEYGYAGESVIEVKSGGGGESMTEETPIQKSLAEQIFDELFANIEGREEFDAGTIQKLKQLAISGDLKKAPQVTKAIKPESG